MADERTGRINFERKRRCLLTTVLAAVVAASAEPPAERSHMDYPAWGLLPAGGDLDGENDDQAF